MSKKTLLGVALLVIGIIGLIVVSTVQFAPSIYTSPAATTLLIPKNIDEATELANSYVASLGYPDLTVKEVMEFEYNFYIIFYEKSTGVGAFEMLIWKTGSNAGRIVSEPGPNMMWNAKYGSMMGQMGGGMMGGGMMGDQSRGLPTADMPLSEGEAKGIGQQYLDQYFPGATIEESTRFYGYYTFDFEKEGKIYGMFSVNGYSGQTWYHGWHGAFMDMEEYGNGHQD